MAINIDKSQVFYNIGLSFINISTELSTAKPFSKGKRQRKRHGAGNKYRTLPLKGQFPVWRFGSQDSRLTDDVQVSYRARKACARYTQPF